MAKNAKSSSSSPSFRSLIYLGLLVAIGAGGWWTWQNTDVKDVVYQYVENGEILTLESRYTPEQIMEAHRAELIGTEKRAYQEPISKYSPYLLLQIKYFADDKKSREGIVLWGMEEGEIVWNTDTWELTHGFKDCLDCEANREDFKIIRALSKRFDGSASVEDLQKELHVERDVFDAWLAHAKDNHLIIQKGNVIQLHFENPKLIISPQTQLKQHLVSKPISNIQKASKAYSRNQLVKMAKAAFGEGFTIRSEQEIFLPVYTLSVKNSDGSVHFSDWNAVTGELIKSSYFGTKK